MRPKLKLPIFGFQTFSSSPRSSSIHALRVFQHQNIDKFTDLHYLDEGDAVAYYPLKDAKEDGVWLRAAGTGVATLPIENIDSAKVKIVWKANITLPIQEGDTLAWANLVDADGNVYSQVNLEATKSVAKKGIWSLLENFKQN